VIRDSWVGSSQRGNYIRYHNTVDKTLVGLFPNSIVLLNILRE